MIDSQPPNSVEHARIGRKKIGERRHSAEGSQRGSFLKCPIHGDDSVVRTIALILLALSLGWAVWDFGGVLPQKWAWSALGISMAACIVIVSGALHNRRAKTDAGVVLLGLLLGWMIFQVTPLPPAWISVLSPNAWSTAAAARAALGQDLNAWLPLSLAPALTIERLLYVVPAMAAFVAMREIGARPGGRTWKPVAAILAVATIEGILGLLQFSGGNANRSLRVSGTYVNPNHFAGLLEMAFPLGIAWAAARWKRGRLHRTFPVPVAWQIAALLGASFVLILAIFASQSRMAIIAVLASLAVVLAALLSRRADRREIPAGEERTTLNVLRWLVPIALPVFALVALSPLQAILRFAAPDQLSGSGRMEIWRETLRAIHAYPLTGCGLGAFERALYPFRMLAPDKTVDFAHNDYLQIIAELGWPGALLVGLLAAWTFWSVLRTVIRGSCGPSWELAVGIFGALVAIGVHSLTDFNLYIPANAIVLAWIAGLAVSATVQDSE